MLIAATLIGRSVSDIWMIQNATVVESTIIHMNRGKFKTALLKYLAALPAVSPSLQLLYKRNISYNLYYFHLDLCGYQRAEMESGRAETAFPHKSNASSVQSVPEVSGVYTYI